jgi:TRAP-type transport system periplasmic protein
MASSKFTELRKFVSLTNHMVGWSAVIVSESSFSAMPADLQQIVIEEAGKAGDLLSKLKRDSDADILQKLKDSGITVVEDIDRDAFRKASMAAYKSFSDWTPGLIETIRGIIDN